MAYAGSEARGGLFSHLFSTFKETNAVRSKRAVSKQSQNEIWRMSERELLDLGYCQSELEAILHYHHLLGDGPTVSPSSEEMCAVSSSERTASKSAAAAALTVLNDAWTYYEPDDLVAAPDCDPELFQYANAA